MVGSLAEADLHVVNSCTVTHRAARDSRKVARRGRRVRPGLRTVLTGCYATASPQEAAGLAGVDLVVPNGEKDGLLERIHRAFPGSTPGVPAPETGRGEPPGPVPDLAFGNTRAAVKIEDGCNVGCAFCVIPSTRGGQRSRPTAEVVGEVRALAAAGSREVVLTGVQISHYRWQGRGLVDLLEELLVETDVRRLRLTSLAPWAFDRRLPRLLVHRRLCRHVHLSLQSGCDRTLRRMGRPYTTAAYAELVAELRRAVPGIAITTDVIVGFPGETAADFEASRAFVEAAGFARTHVFPFSAREGTAAAALPDPLPPATVKERTRTMLDVARAAVRRFREEQVGAILEVLWEAEEEGAASGTSDNYLRVTAPTVGAPRGGSLAGRVTPALIVGMTEGGLAARAAFGAEAETELPPPRSRTGRRAAGG